MSACACTAERESASFNSPSTRYMANSRGQGIPEVSSEVLWYRLSAMVSGLGSIEVDCNAGCTVNLTKVATRGDCTAGCTTKLFVFLLG